MRFLGIFAPRAPGISKGQVPSGTCWLAHDFNRIDFIAISDWKFHQFLLCLVVRSDIGDEFADAGRDYNCSIFHFILSENRSNNGGVKSQLWAT